MKMRKGQKRFDVGFISRKFLAQSDVNLTRPLSLDFTEIVVDKPHIDHV
jgi:hypothetical protein